MNVYLKMIWFLSVFPLKVCSTYLHVMNLSVV